MKQIKPGKIPDFKQRLNKLRGEMSNTEFAEMVGISRQTMGFYLNGDRIPDAEMLIKICKATGVSSDYLLGLSDETTPDQTVRSVCEYTGLSPAAVNLLHFEPEPQIKSFYRTLIDALVVHSDQDGIENIPSYIRKAAQAHVMSHNSKKDVVTTALLNTKSQIDMDTTYTISASDAEKFYMSRANETVQRVLSLLLESLEYNAIDNIEGQTSVDSQNYWSHNDNALTDEDYEPWFPE
jgi:transcriptional regulator with XRE-family HTH domain